MNLPEGSYKQLHFTFEKSDFVIYIHFLFFAYLSKSNIDTLLTKYACASQVEWESNSNPLYINTT